MNPAECVALTFIDKKHVLLDALGVLRFLKYSEQETTQWLQYLRSLLKPTKKHEFTALKSNLQNEKQAES